MNTEISGLEFFVAGLVFGIILSILVPDNNQQNMIIAYIGLLFLVTILVKFGFLIGKHYLKKYYLKI